MSALVLMISTSSRADDTDGALLIDAAVAGDASCRVCLGVTVAVTFSHAAVKSPALTGVGGNELAFLLDSSKAFR